MVAVNLSTVEQIIRDVAQNVIMPRFRKLASHDVEMKGVNDPVTIADKESERELTKRLAAYMPNSAVVGEESFAADKAILSRLDNEHPVWIIDPIDGTRNFVAGVPEFAVMVALVSRRESLASWIHDPNSGDMIMAEHGGGVWLRGQRLSLASTSLTDNAVGLVGGRVKKLLQPIIGLPRLEIGSCAGFDYPRLFNPAMNGEAAFANASTSRASFLLYHHTNAWDHVPGMLMHKEAGGYSADWHGNPYDMSQTRNGLLYAPDKDSWQHLHTLFQPVFQNAKGKVA